MKGEKTLTKGEKTLFTIVVTALVILVLPIILFGGMFVAVGIGNEMITQKDVEKYGKKMQPKSGIVFPADTTFVRGHWVKYSICQERYAGWFYTSKDPFQLPENVEVDIYEDDMDMYEDWFSGYFEKNITGATEYKRASWTTNGFDFEAEILKTPDQYYLHLGSEEVVSK